MGSLKLGTKLITFVISREKKSTKGVNFTILCLVHCLVVTLYGAICHTSRTYVQHLSKQSKPLNKSNDVQSFPDMASYINKRLQS